MTITSVRADGALLAGFDVPATTPEGHNVRPSLYWPIGVTFDGSNLYYSQPCQCTSGIFQTTTNGVLIRTLTEVSQVGALAWDGSHLWAGSFPTNAVTCTSDSTGCAYITEIDPASGNAIQTVDLSAVFAGDQECGFIDGLSYDSSNGSFWVSPDIGCLCSIVPNCDAIGFIYDVNMAGQLLQRVQEPFGVAGVAKVGDNLYMVAEGYTPHGRAIVQTTLAGTVVSSFPTISVSGQHESAESIAFDPSTFAPNCALWAVQDYGFPFDASLAAYQIACP
ncbi:MAG TPA: hypothetical protein VFJ63_01000 [Candidatus Bathyarchaeia archaeon]|nr:hypothetical protein [Candidatus Bathyarchaeia archaeon]